MLSKVLSAHACILLTLPLFPKTNFYPLHTFYKIQANSLSEGAHNIASENHKPTGPPVVQSTAVSNEAGPSINSQAKHTAEETNVLSIVIPTPEKKRSAKKLRKRQETRHTTSDSYLKQTLAKYSQKGKTTIS
jgi:hypothetical protein